MLKTMMGYVNECVLVLLIRGYDNHDCVANPQSLVSYRYLVGITGQSACRPDSKFTHCTGNEYMYPYNVQHLV